MKGKLSAAAGFAAGYVLGAKAGRERYEQLSQAAQRFAEKPSLQQLANDLRDIFAGTQERTLPAADQTAGQTAEPTGGQTEKVTDLAATPARRRASSSRSSASGTGGSGTRGGTGGSGTRGGTGGTAGGR